MKTATIFNFLILSFFLSLVACNTENEKNENNDDDIKEEFTPSANIKYGFPIDDYRVVVDTIRPNETLSNILSGYNVSGAQIYELAEKTKDIFPVRKFRANHQYSLLFCSPEETAKPQYFIYEKNASTYIVYDLKDSINISIEERPKEKKVEIYGNTIKNSLWHSLTEHGKSPALAMSLADVYQWTIDFYGIQKGDAYRVLYSEDYVANKPVGNIHPIVSTFTHKDSTYYAFWFQDGNIKGYFDENGASLHKAFLKTPLKFSRISSRFSGNRFHPVTGKYRPHLGVDYAAPTGTPIHCVGDGTVIKKTYQRGGAGNYVKIRHNRTYTTLYMHMVRHAKGLKVGQHVTQGQIIGYVGMTGLATGPHLHYSVIKNGKYIDPLRMQSPPKKPLSKDILKKFMNTKDSLLQVFNRK